MEAILMMTDEQRVEVLNTVFRKGIQTPKEQLPFGSEKLSYIMPFISKLQQSGTEDLASRMVVRRIVDELLQDIADEIVISCNSSSSNKKLGEFGLTQLTQPAATCNARQVA